MFQTPSIESSRPRCPSTCRTRALQCQRRRDVRIARQRELQLDAGGVHRLARVVVGHPRDERVGPHGAGCDRQRDAHGGGEVAPVDDDALRRRVLRRGDDVGGRSKPAQDARHPQDQRGDDQLARHRPAERRGVAGGLAAHPRHQPEVVARTQGHQDQDQAALDQQRPAEARVEQPLDAADLDHRPQDPGDQHHRDPVGGHDGEPARPGHPGYGVARRADPEAATAGRRSTRLRPTGAPTDRSGSALAPTTGCRRGLPAHGRTSPRLSRPEDGDRQTSRAQRGPRSWPRRQTATTTARATS